MKVVKRILQKPILNLRHNRNCMQVFSIAFGSITITKTVWNCFGSLPTWASIPLWSASLYRGRYLRRIPIACCLKMAVMYTVLSTAETGLWKTLYTKISPSSEVVPAGKKGNTGFTKGWKRWKRTCRKASVGGRPGIKCDSVITVNKQYASSWIIIINMKH